MVKHILLLLFMSSHYFLVKGQVAAFPGAEGGGMYSTGGRGGDVYFVNTLQDDEKGDKVSREGSLRWCLQQPGTKTILFKLSGTIFLNSRLTIEIGDLTIAGQSAPGAGITLAGYPVSIRADNVIVRFLRFRMGDLKISTAEADGADAFSGGKNKNIVIDHCSISWGTDECSSFYDNKYFTMQWCIISESLRLSSHSKGAHGYGAIWGGVHATFHHNLLAHHDSRAPRLGPGAKYAGMDTTDVRNNVIYNWSGNGAYGGEAMHINMVNNFYKKGPATIGPVKDRIVALNAKTEERPFPSIKDVWGKYYIHGNLLPHNASVSADNWSGVEIVGAKSQSAIRLHAAVSVHGTVQTDDPEMAYQRVLNYAGASLCRDAVDTRIIQETKTGTAEFRGKNPHNGQGGDYKSLGYPRAGIVDSQQDLKPENASADWSAWPHLTSLSPPADSDNDGIPDVWMAKSSSDLKNRELLDAGYTLLEVYLHSLVEKTMDARVH